MAIDGIEAPWAGSVTTEQASVRTNARTNVPSGRMEVLAGPERRRRWSDEQKRSIVAECCRPGVSLSAVARRHDLSPGLLHTWRHRFARVAASAFARVELAGETRCLETSARPPGTIEIVLRDGTVVRTDGSIGEPALRRVLAALRA